MRTGAFSTYVMDEETADSQLLQLIFVPSAMQLAISCHFSMLSAYSLSM